MVDALTMIERLVSLRNDLDLVAEEYDPAADRQHGNFPQAFSRIGLVTVADNLISVPLGGLHIIRSHWQTRRRATLVRLFKLSRRAGRVLQLKQLEHCTENRT